MEEEGRRELPSNAQALELIGRLKEERNLTDQKLGELLDMEDEITRSYEAMVRPIRDQVDELNSHAELLNVLAESVVVEGTVVLAIRQGSTLYRACEETGRHALTLKREAGEKPAGMLLMVTSLGEQAGGRDILFMADGIEEQARRAAARWVALGEAPDMRLWQVEEPTQIRSLAGEGL